MKSKDEARLNMYETVYNQGTKNLKVIATIRAFETAHTVLGGICVAIRANNLISTTARTGASKDKAALKKSMTDIAIVHASALAAYADASGNNVLFDKSNLSPTTLERASDSEVEDVCKMIHTLATENLTNLADYGITSTSVGTLENSILAYHNAITSPRELQSQAKAANANIKTLFKQGNKVLKNQMDKLAKGFKTTYPEFATEYVSNREIVDAPTTSTSLTGQLVFGDVGIKGTVTILDLNIVLPTDATGSFQVKPIAFGIHTIKAEADDPSFAINIQENVQCKLGRNTTISIEMKKK